MLFFMFRTLNTLHTIPKWNCCFLQNMFQCYIYIIYINNIIYVLDDNIYLCLSIYLSVYLSIYRPSYLPT